MSTLIQRDSLQKMIIKLYNNVKNEKNMQAAFIRVKLVLLQDAWDKFLVAHFDVVATTGEADKHLPEAVFDQVEELYTKARICLYTASDKLPQPSQQTSASQPPQPPQPPAKTIEVKLPRIELPKFYGNYQTWTSFQDLFSSLIHKNKSFTGAQKLHYLKANIDGEAAQLLRSYQVTDANYSEAWNALKERYDNKRLIVNSHLKTLFGQSSINSESAFALRKLLDTTTECVRSLNVLDLPTDHWDDFIVFLVVQKLDVESHRQWELSLTTAELPTFDQLTQFLNGRCRSLEAVGMNKPKPINQPRRQPLNPFQAITTRSFVTTQTIRCGMCSAEHYITNCSNFLALTIRERLNIAQKNNLCFNCLSSSHSSARLCRSGTCRKCRRHHHTLLHIEGPPQSEEQVEGTTNINSNVSQAIDTTDTQVESLVGTNTTSKTEVLLATAIMKCRSADGSPQLVRALLDTGSQATFITEDCVQRLKLRRRSGVVSISGVGANSSCVSHSAVSIEISSCIDHSFSTTIKALVLKKITNYLPNREINVTSWPQLQSINLADPEFNKPNKIDILIGADVYGSILLGGIIPGAKAMPTAQQTVFGWILSGPVICSNLSKRFCTTNCHAELNLDAALRKFWEVEEVAAISNSLSKDDERCEQLFNQTHYRTENGRYVVKLPFKTDTVALGQSRFGAIKRFLNLERRFEEDVNFKRQYIAFMTEYEQLGHMELAQSMQNISSYYLPHHGVIKEESTTTKLRVVFDASARTDTGTTLNENLLIGPRLQDDLVTILLRFRKYPIAFTSDIAKMYRQVLVDDSCLDYQRIIWRKTPSEQLQDYRLKTVTYGMASAPYCAIKALQQVAIDNSETYPLAANIIKNDFYVDDLITGCFDEDAETTDADDDEGHQDDQHLHPHNEKKDYNKNDEKSFDEKNASSFIHHQNSLMLNSHDSKSNSLELQEQQQSNANGEIPLPLWWPQLDHRNKGLSSSQQDFFRMLDQKIEDGPDYDSNSEKEIALEDLRISGLLERWESASITASMCSSNSRSLQNTPVRQQQISLRQQLRTNQPQPLSAELLSKQQQMQQHHQPPQHPIISENSSPKRDTRSLLSQSTIHQSYGITASPTQQQQQQIQQQDRRYWSMPTPLLRMQQPFVGQFQMTAPLGIQQTQQSQMPLPPIQLPQQPNSIMQPGLLSGIEPRFPPAISVQRLAPQVQRQIRETQELIKETCPQRYAAGYGSPGPPAPRSQQRQQPQTPQQTTRRNPLETHYSQELS